MPSSPAAILVLAGFGHAIAGTMESARREIEKNVAKVLAAHDFEPELRGTLQALASQAAVDPPGEIGRTTVERMRGSGAFGIEQRFPWGGSISADVGGAAARRSSWTPMRASKSRSN
jgi:hypothetical protein